ncbi:MAG: DUF2490 domain-containing protein [Pseudomonadota bacterium]
MSTLRKFLVVGGLAATALPAAAHADDFQHWETVSVQVGLGGPWRVSNETVVRTSDARGLYELENNLLLGYKLNKQVTVWAGYTHAPSYLHGDFTIMEHRARQQVTFDNILKIGEAKLSARLRVEERWREGISGTGWRVRPYAKVALPVANGGKTSVVYTHESFVNLNSTAFQRTTGHDRMRNFVGINTLLIKPVNLEFGYLNQHGFVRNGPDTDDHVLSISLSANF